MIKKFISQWQEPVIVAPVIFLLAVGYHLVVPQIDPRSGVDSLGFIGGVIEGSLLVAAIFFWTWYYRRTYGATDEDGRRENAAFIRKEHPRLFYVAELLKQLLVLLVVVYCFMR